ncbi:tetratricopeptide repeat protein [Marinicella sp. W31]|uniref:protein kinase domain-containing protein n=1 Tax=Marinicella sp. W31 TaxID=3023713 RepID=UPI003756C67A
MTEDDKQLEQLAEDLADGKAIDWTSSKLSNTGQRRLIDQLNAIADISKAFNSVESKLHPQKPTKKFLFEWGHLQVLEKIGEGSYGEVYRAYDSVLDRDVALKLLKKDKLAPIQSRAFIQEARRLAKIRNRHVLAIHGANINDGRVGIWSDLIDGINLAEVLHNRSSYMSYGTKQLISMIQALADALIAVHDAGLIHGDIKPSNVMVDTHNKYTLMDFGAGTESTADSGQSGYLMGTLLYMAPELFEENELSSASDIYALGVLLFHWITGDHPVKGKSMPMIKQAHTAGKYTSLNQYQHQLPKKLTRLIQQMLLPEPKARPSAVSISNELNWIITAPQRRNKRLALSIIVGLSVTGALISSIGFYRANQAQQIAVQEKEKAEIFSDFMKDTLKAPASLGKGKEVKVADLLGTAAEEAAVKFVDQPHTKAAIFQLIGDSYSSLQLPEDALRHLSESLSIQKRLHGKQSPEILTSLVQVALQNYKLGHIPESKNQYLAAIDIANLHEMPKVSVLAQIRLASISADEGNYQQAETTLKDLLLQMPVDYDSSESHPGNNNRFLALIALANNHLDQNQYSQAESTAKQALNFLQKHFANTSDINIYNTKTAIATALSQQGKFAEAEKYFTELVGDAEALFGENNRGYFNSIFNLGTVLQDQGKLKQALPLLEQALAISKEIKQGRNFLTMNVSNNLANLKSSLKDFEGAEKLMRETLSMATDTLANDHRFLLMVELNLSEILNLSKQHKEAEMLAQESYLKMQQALGDDHLFTLLILDQLAISMAGQNNLVEAEKIQRELMTEFQQGNLNKTPEMIQVHSHLVDTLILAEKNTEASDELRLLIEIQKEMMGSDHPDIERYQQKLSKLEAKIQ